MIAARLTPFLEPLERFQALHARVRRLGRRVADLSYANFGGPVPASVHRVLRDALGNDRDMAFQYTPFEGTVTARRAIADALSESHHDEFDWQDIVVTNGASPALSLCMHCLGQPGDEVVIPVPCWFDHPLFVEGSGRTAVLVPLAANTAFDLDLAAIRQAITHRTAGIIVGNPANPTGRTYPPATLRALGQLLAGTSITVIADETHRDLASAAFTTCAAHHDRTLIVYSFGKYHSIQGQRLGYVAVAPRHPSRERVRSDLGRMARVAGNTSPTALMQLAVPGLLALKHATTELDGWRDRYRCVLRTSGFDLVEGDGTPFLYAATPAGMDDELWVETLVEEHRVLVMPATVFHHRGYFRLSLTGAEDTLAKGLAALQEAGARWCRTSQ